MADKALQPLYQTLQQKHLSDPHQHLPLWKKVELLRNVLKENHEKITKSFESDDFKIRIQEAVYEAKDAIESGSSDLTDHVVEGLDSIYQDILNLKHSQHAADTATLSKLLSEYYLLPSPIEDRVFLFGFDGRIDLLVYGLIRDDRDEPEVEVRVFVGMAGVGKTTFARQVYDHVKVANHFDIRGWVQFSHPFDLRLALLALLIEWNRQEEGSMLLKSDQELGECVFKMLTGRRYFLVIDDVYNAIAWDKLKQFFPGNSEGSCIILTTRERSVANYVTYSAHHISPLDDEASWKLFSHIVFGLIGEHFPPEFLETGKKIARNCKGNPLIVKAIAGLLRNNMRLDFWNNVLRKSCLLDMRERVSSIEEQLLKILMVPASLPSASADPSSKKAVAEFETDTSELVDELISFGILMSGTK